MDQGKSQRREAVIRWPRQSMCILESGASTPAIIRDICARGAFLETGQRPPLGTNVRLRHPQAGAISAVVRAVAADGIAVSFPAGAHSVGFALAATVAGMGDAA